MNALQILGLILLVITYIIHKNTYSKEYNYKNNSYNYEKLPSPLWMWILAFLISIIPFLNIIIFIFAFIIYFILVFVEEDISLNPKSKVYKTFNKIITILTKNV